MSSVFEQVKLWRIIAVVAAGGLTKRRGCAIFSAAIFKTVRETDKMRLTTGDSQLAVYPYGGLLLSAAHSTGVRASEMEVIG